MTRICLAALCVVFGLAAAAAAEPGIKVSDVWMRASLGQVPTTAAYLTIENQGAQADKLLAVSTPVAGMSHLHNSVEKDGVVQMLAVNALGIAPGETVALSPGGMHIMVMNLKGPLKAGEHVPLTLRFEQAGEVEVLAEVRGLDGAPHKH